MGVRYPAEPGCRLPPRPPDAASLAGSALVLAEAAVRDAVPAGMRHAAATAAGRRVAAEIALTRQQVRAIERHWIPRLHEALDLSRLELEEYEHAEAVRRRWATAGSATETSRERP